MSDAGLSQPNYDRLLLMTVHVGSFILPAFVVARLFESSGRELLSLKPPASRTALLLLPLIMFFAFPVINALYAWNMTFDLPQVLVEQEEVANDMLDSILTMNGWLDYILAYLAIALLPAVGEELLYRGVVQHYLMKLGRNPHISILVTAMIFSAMHFQFMGFVPRFALGLILGYLCFWSGSILPGMILHFINNAWGVTVQILLQKEVVSQEADTYGEEISWIPVLIYATICAALLHRFRDLNRKKSA